MSARVTTPKDNFSQDPRAPVDKTKDDYTLDTYSIVNKNSEIQPYFVKSVANDPDVRGLTVFVQDYSGKTVSRKVRYQLELDEEEPPEELPEELPQEALWEIPAGTETPAAENPDEAAGEVSPEAPVSDVTETVQAEFPETVNNAWAGEPESPAEPPPELPGAGFDAPAADYAADSPADSFGGTGGGQTGTALPSAETEIAEAEIVPAETAAVPAETETAPVEIAEAAAAPGETETAEAETGAEDSGGAGEPGTDAPGPDTPSLDATAPPPPLAVAPPEETPKPVIPEDQIILVKQLDQYLPMFRITEDIEIGRYNLVFQVMGKGTDVILYRTFKPIYFLGDAKFTLEDIQSFLPMAVTTRGQLIPMGINVMLKTEIKADERLDPYVIWHNGKKILAQGRVSGGADYLFWKTPEKTGFHNIRAEVFPLLSGERVPGNMMGKIKELSLPVSSKSEGIQQFNESSGEFAGWYQFWGTLDDAKAVDNAQRRLASLYAQPPRWIPFKEIYSLFVGREDVYTLPGTPFKLAQGEQGTGRMYFHLAALSEGSVLSVRFAPQEQPRRSTDRQSVGETADGTAALDLFLAGDALILRIASEDASREKSLPLNGGEFITVELVFAIAPDRFDAELRLENPAETTGPLSVALAKPISGEGAIILGGGEKPAGYKKSAKLPVFGETEAFGGGTMALNELAFSYDRAVPENEEDDDSGISESLLPQEEEPGAEQEPSSLSAL
ncbi:MAG: hypothetical protein LBK77_05185 [Spirochaetaceae bacterium]|nr:hypothetical protein [Spirochaetaceae bacterium]